LKNQKLSLTNRQGDVGMFRLDNEASEKWLERAKEGGRPGRHLNGRLLVLEGEGKHVHTVAPSQTLTWVDAESGTTVGVLEIAAPDRLTHHLPETPEKAGEHKPQELETGVYLIMPQTEVVLQERRQVWD
jgi:hypothetical protein